MVVVYNLCALRCSLIFLLYAGSTWLLLRHGGSLNTKCMGELFLQIGSKGLTKC
jgi:hypothetical protein